MEPAGAGGSIGLLLAATLSMKLATVFCSAEKPGFRASRILEAMGMPRSALRSLLDSTSLMKKLMNLAASSLFLEPAVMEKWLPGRRSIALEALGPGSGMSFSSRPAAFTMPGYWLV
ncbi:hypothetical protein D3C75_1052530 [compost metagenome]